MCDHTAVCKLFALADHVGAGQILVAYNPRGFHACSLSQGVSMHEQRDSCMQVREYFVKTGVFHVLSTNRMSADGTTTTSGGVDNSPTDFPSMPPQSMQAHSTPELHGTPALHSNSGARGMATGAAASGHTTHGSGLQGGMGPSYSVPMHHGAFSDPTDHLPRSVAFSLANPRVLPATCNTEPPPQRNMQEMQTRLSHHGGGGVGNVGLSMLAASQPQLPPALPLPSHSGVAGAPANSQESLPDRSATLHMRALMEAIHVMQTHRPDSVAAQHACMIAQAACRLGPQANMHGGLGAVARGSMDMDANAVPHASAMLPADMDLMQQLANQMHAPNASSMLQASNLPVMLNPQYHAAMQLMWAPADPNNIAHACKAASLKPATSGAASAPAAAAVPAPGAVTGTVHQLSTSTGAAGNAPQSPATASAPGTGGASGAGGALSAVAASAGGQASGCGDPSAGGINDASATSAGGSPSAT
jgi:hypothetical protein